MSLIKILIDRDGLTREEAIAQIREAKAEFNARLVSGETTELYDFMEEWFGLEPDYLEEFIG